MKKISLFKYQIFSVIFAIVFGTILHFLFEWLNGNTFIATFSAVNESTWEHMKIAFFPMLITLIIGLFIYKKSYSNFLCAKTIGILVALIFIPVFFYTYTGIIGRNFAVIDISSFVLAISFGEFITYRLIKNKFNCNNEISFIILIGLILMFIVFTFKPLYINLFKDPLTGLYGIIN